MINILFYILIFLTLWGFCGRYVWHAAVADFFRLQYAALLLVVCVYYGLNEERLYALICVVCVALNLFRIRGYFPFIHKRPKSNGRYDFMSINIYKDSSKYEKLNAYVKKVDPVVITLLEVTDKNETQDLKDIFERYPHRIYADIREGFKTYLMSKVQLINTKVYHLGTDNTPLLKADIIHQGQSLRVFSAHPKPSLNARCFRARNSYFDDFAKIVQGTPSPIIALGDFNSVPWEHQFKKFMDSCQMKPALYLQGYKITWPAVLPILGIPMDHILISNDLEVECFKTGPFVYSDHYPVSLKIKK